MVRASSGVERKNRSVVPFPSNHSPLNEKICGCRIGTPVVMRATSTPDARSSPAKASMNSLGSVRLRASVISQRMTGWLSALSVSFNTDSRLNLGVDNSLQGCARGIAMLRLDMGCDHADRGGKDCGIVGKAEHRQHVGNEVERQDEIGDRSY